MRSQEKDGDSDLTKYNKCMKDDFIEKAKNKYKYIQSPVRCNCLNRNIIFNSDGFMHLLRNGQGSPRPLKEIQHKTRLIPLIIPVLRNATDASYEKRIVKKNRKKNAPIVVAEYWGISAKVGKSDIAVRVIVRRIGSGEAHFWSVM